MSAKNNDELFGYLRKYGLEDIQERYEKLKQEIIDKCDDIESGYTIFFFIVCNKSNVFIFPLFTSIFDDLSPNN